MLLLMLLMRMLGVVVVVVSAAAAQKEAHDGRNAHRHKTEGKDAQNHLQPERRLGRRRAHLARRQRIARRALKVLRFFVATARLP